MKALLAVFILLCMVACAPPVTKASDSSPSTEVSIVASEHISGDLTSEAPSVSLSAPDTSKSEETESTDATSHFSGSATSEIEFQCECDTGEDMFQEGTYVDGVIIKLIGREHYEQWLEDNLHEEATVYKLVEDFGLSWDELKDILHESIYTKYIENMPKP